MKTKPETISESSLAKLTGYSKPKLRRILAVCQLKPESGKYPYPEVVKWLIYLFKKDIMLRKKYPQIKYDSWEISIYKMWGPPNRWGVINSSK